MQTKPIVLLIYPEQWLERRRKEWGPLAAAASAVGFHAIVAPWEALTLEDGAVTARDVLVQWCAAPDIRHTARLAFSPDVVLTTWGVQWDRQGMFDEMLATSRCYHSESSLLSWLDGKCELELCLREYEAATGASIPRPHTLVCDEIAARDAAGGDELVIVKPSRGGQCKGIEIVPRCAVASLAAEAAAGTRPPFVVQTLVDDVFLYKGRRWDMRIHAMATSLSPLAYRTYPEGVAKTTGVVARPGSARLDEWLNAESHLEGVQRAENLSVSEMLRYVEREYLRLPGFWARVDELVGNVFRSIAHSAQRWPRRLDREVLVPGFDLIVERRGEEDYEVKLLELNSHPGLGWEPRISACLALQFRAWFGDLLHSVQSGMDERGADG
jgi:hypothetical protein